MLINGKSKMNLKREKSIKIKNDLIRKSSEKETIKPIINNNKQEFYDIYKNNDEYIENNLKKSLIEMVSTRKKKTKK